MSCSAQEIRIGQEESKNVMDKIEILLWCAWWCMAVARGDEKIKSINKNICVKIIIIWFLDGEVMLTESEWARTCEHDEGKKRLKKYSNRLESFKYLLKLHMSLIRLRDL